EVQAAQGDGDELAAGGLERGDHRLIGRVLAGAHEEARAQLYAGDDEGVFGGDRLHDRQLTDGCGGESVPTRPGRKAPGPPSPQAGRLWEVLLYQERLVARVRE